MPWRELYWHCNFFFDKVSHLKHPNEHTYICIYLVFGSCLRTDLVFPTLAGYIFYKSMEGRAESEMDRTYGEKSLSNKKSFNKEAMMTEILKGGGEANLAKVRSIKKSRFQIARLRFPGEGANEQKKAGDRGQSHHLRG